MRWRHALENHRNRFWLASRNRRGWQDPDPRPLASALATSFHRRRRLEACCPAVRAGARHSQRSFLESREAAMSSYLVAVYLLIEAHENPRAEVAGVLQGVLTDGIRKYAGGCRFGFDPLGDCRRRHRVLDRAGHAAIRSCTRRDGISPLAWEDVLMSVASQRRCSSAWKMRFSKPAVTSVSSNDRSKRVPSV